MKKFFMFWVYWIPSYFLSVSFGAGIYTAMQGSAQTASNFEQGYQMGYQFGTKYGGIFLFATFIISFFGTILGWLPGTKKKLSITDHQKSGNEEYKESA